MPPAKDQIQEFPLTFEGGLVTEVEESTLEVGQAASVVNWIPTAQGGLRARNAWSAISSDGLTPDFQVRGWGTAAIIGGGAGTPSIVQKTTDSNATMSNIALVCTLNGVTQGNILVAVVNCLSSPPDMPDSGYTLRVEAANPAGQGTNVSLWTKTAVGSSETCTMDDANNVLLGMTLYELSTVTTEAPTDSDVIEAGFGTTGCTSATSSGVAITAGLQEGVAPWGNSDPENAPGGTGWTQDLSADDGTNGFNFTVASKVYSTTSVTDVMDGSGGAQMAGLTAIWDAAAAAATPADFKIFIAVATSTGYSIYQISRDQILTGTWELVDSAVCDDTSAFVSMAVGAGTLVWSASTMDVPRSVVLSTLTAANVTDLTSKAGRAVCYHKDRMFVGGSAAEPARVYFSDIGTPTSFTTATDFMDVGGDDGEAIEDLMSVEGLLLVCKVNRLYLISGSGIESFFTNELAGGSAATGRAAVRTPYGTIVAGPTDIWVVQGGGVDPMSRPLGEDYSITGLVSTAYAQDTVLIADSGTGRTWKANLVTGSWALEEVDDDENDVGHLFSLQGRLYYGVIDSETEVGGTRRLSSARSFDFVGGTRFEAATGKMALLGPSVTYTPRHLYLQVRNHDALLPNALHITVTTDLGEEEQAEMIDEEVKRYRFDLGRFSNASWIKVAFEANSSAIAGALDVERSVLSTFVDGVR